MMRHFFKFFLILSLTLLTSACASWFGSSSKAKPKGAKSISPYPDTDTQSTSFTMSQRELLNILSEQKALIDEALSDKEKLRNELASRFKILMGKWSAYLAKYPDDVEAIIIYGKFMRQIGENEAAYNAFKKADELKPNLAVVKQQLATYEGDTGNYEDSYKNLLLAIELDPESAIYRYQLGELLSVFRSDFLINDILTQEDLDVLLLKSFKEAHLLDKKNMAFFWRYAQSFYDVKSANWQEAFDAWEELIPLLYVQVDKETAYINKARVLIELYRDDEALALMENIHHPSLIRDKARLIEVIKRENHNDEPKKTFEENIKIPLMPEKTYTQ